MNVTCSGEIEDIKNDYPLQQESVLKALCAPPVFKASV